jgi:IclR family transcriptional regulator, acetate operon repressor
VTEPSGTQDVERAARLLTEVVRSPDSVSFTELAAAAGLSKVTTSRLLFALARNGLVRRDDQGGFLPGEVFVQFAWRGGAKAGLAQVAQPFLERLGKATRETINLGVACGGLVEQIAQVDSTYMIGGTDWVGLSVPAISVSGPTLRLARDRVTAAAGCCVQEAAALSIVLGYRPQEPPTAPVTQD